MAKRKDYNGNLRNLLHIAITNEQAYFINEGVANTPFSKSEFCRMIFNSGMVELKEFLKEVEGDWSKLPIEAFNKK